MKISPNTPLLFYKRNDGYTSGSGAVTTWSLLKCGNYEAFWAEWKGAYGDRAYAAASTGNKSTATLRMYYNPTLYEAMRTGTVVVVKNADPTAIVGGVPDMKNANLYEVWGEPDNVREENLFLEFLVRRYEGV